jgi:hypothetical protein
MTAPKEMMAILEVTDEDGGKRIVVRYGSRVDLKLSLAVMARIVAGDGENATALRDAARALLEAMLPGMDPMSKPVVRHD